MPRSSLRWIIPTFMALQLGLLWLQGVQLHRQNQALQGLREDIRVLTETLESSLGPAPGEEEAMAVPASFFQSPPPRQQAAVLGAQEEQEAASKDLQASRESAQKAVKDAREAQSKVSVAENARKAEEAKKVQSATDSWSTWSLAAVGLVALALVVRALLRRRG